MKEFGSAMVVACGVSEAANSGTGNQYLALRVVIVWGPRGPRIFKLRKLQLFLCDKGGISNFLIAFRKEWFCS